ncbi:WD repeat-containing protein 31 isoform X3 [Petromyzon marinus]|uniref:WD repeat-containing protein 31 isoform X2 n=1 Tax=Petromyzon marinus TaxID=7757 RepID=A0AAJ7X8X7_PETMA|nr:WD repeat-containing protein 31 isoform X2 [Petromyzon marinus]
MSICVQTTRGLASAGGREGLPCVPRVNVCIQGKNAETPGRLVKNLPQAPPRYLSGFNGARRLPRLSVPQVAMGKLQSKPSVRPHKYRVESPACALGEASVRHFPRVHRDAVASLTLLGPALSLSGSKDCTVVLFDWERGELCARLLGHTRDVTKVACVPGGTHVFSASRDRTACMWHRAHPADGPVASFSGHELVLTGLSLNHDGSVLCTGSRDNALCFWDVDTGVCVRRASLPRNLVTDVCWVPGSALVAQTSEDKTVRLWDSRTAQVSVLFPPKCHIQTSCAASPGATQLLSTSAGVNAEGCEATYRPALWPCGRVARASSCGTGGNRAVLCGSSTDTARAAAAAASCPGASWARPRTTARRASGSCMPQSVCA